MLTLFMNASHERFCWPLGVNLDVKLYDDCVTRSGFGEDLEKKLKS
jgi:hypothetical protein